MKRILPFIRGIIIVFPLVLLIAGCTKKFKFSSSSTVPAAEGYVKIKKDKNNNYHVDVSLKNLAPPEKLAPPKAYYVVWMETELNGIKNIGQIQSSSGLLSSTRKARLQTVTSFSPRAIFITAEDQGNIQYPGMYVVMKTDQFSTK